jgi:hypothetical protein
MIVGCSVPKEICFGRGSEKAFHMRNTHKKPGPKHWHQKHSTGTAAPSANIEEVDMTDLAESLPS